MRNIYCPVAYFLLISCLVLAASSCNREVQLNCGFSEASQIGINFLQPFVDAMEKYKVDNGRYPENALQLIPKYIDKIPLILMKGTVYNEESLLNYKTMKNDEIWNFKSNLAEDGSYFSLTFYPVDDRLCLTGGRNNVCEYTSDTKQWGCYAH